MCTLPNVILWGGVISINSEGENLRNFCSQVSDKKVCNLLTVVGGSPVRNKKGVKDQFPNEILRTYNEKLLRKIAAANLKIDGALRQSAK